MNQHWEPGGTGRGRVVLLHGMMSTAASWWRTGAALADGVEADARLVRGDRARLVRREREANPTWATEDVEHPVDGIAAADWQAMAAGLRGELAWPPPPSAQGVRGPGRRATMRLSSPAGKGIAWPSAPRPPRGCRTCCGSRPARST